MVGRDARVLPDGCSVQLAVLVCRVIGRDVVEAMFQAAAGREPLFLDFEVVRPLLFLLPSHVAAHLLLDRVVSLRLGSDEGVRIDLAVAPARLLPVVSLDGKEMEKSPLVTE